MAETDPPVPSEELPAVETVPRRRSLAVRVLRWVGGLLLVLVLLLAAATAWLHTRSGRQFIVDQIAQVAPASGLSVEVGRIEGSALWSSTLYDVKLRDADGVLFLQVPEVEFNWRPHRFLFSGLDVRHLVLHGGTLYAAPRLIPGDPDAPTLPNFDIRVDRFVVDDLRIARGLLGEERVIDFRAKADVRDGLVFLDAEGALGGRDTFDVLVYAEPDGNRFDLDVDFRAPTGGLLAELIGAEEALRIRLKGDGTWNAWDGALVVNQAAEYIGAFKLYNRSGTYKFVGQARPGDYVTGMPARALGEVVSLLGVGTLEDSVLEGMLQLRGRGVSADTEGTINLADNAFEDVELTATLLDNELFGEGMTLDGAVLEATLDGQFRDLTIPHRLRIGELNAGGTVLSNIVQEGELTYDGSRFTVPIRASVQRIVSGNAMVDPRLVNGRLNGTLVYAGNRLVSDDLAIDFPGLSARLALSGDLARGAYGVAGPVRATGFTLENIGTIDAEGRLQFRMGANSPWQLDADFSGRMPRVTNATFANLAGSNVRFRGSVSMAAGQAIVFRNTSLTASKLSLTIDGRVEAGRTTVAGRGRHVDYGPFTVQATMAADGPRATLVFDNPYPAAGLRNVRVSLAPTREGFRVEAAGQSMLGAFDGLFDIVSPPRGATQIAIRRLNVWQTSITGALTLGDGGVTGALRMTGGGVDGTVNLAARNGGQAFDVALRAANARFGGTTPLVIRDANIDATGFFGNGTWSANGTLEANGINYGAMFVSRLAGRAQVTNGRGTFAAQLAGRRGSQFELRMVGDAAPDRIAVAARGRYAGREITMPRRAVLVKTDDGGWQLQKTQLTFGQGIAIAEGRFGGRQPMQGRLSLSSMPLSLIDVAGLELGLGGTVSGIIDMGVGAGGMPVGEARVMINRLSRSGLVLSSRPIDLALVGRLSPTLLQARAVLREGGQTRGRLQGRIAGLPTSGGLMERLNAGDLFAQLRFTGPADALFRLAAMELFDVTGTLQVAADVRGNLQRPQIRGSVAGDALRVQSALTGTDLRNVSARARFSGSRLQLTSVAGTAPNGGRVTGSGIVDFSGLGAGRGPQIDLRMAMRDAEVMDLATMGATVTGPMRIVSNGNGGTIAGRLQVNEARWVLGGAAAEGRLPNIRTREINRRPDSETAAATSAPWRYLIDAVAPGGVMVTGMGLDSEWSADVALRGTTDNPIIGGEASVVPRQGYFSFAGTRFELTRGEIDFDQQSPPDPRIDIRAESDVQDIEVVVTVTGNASRPEIAFSSDPALPEEEVMTRLLFGDSITNLSATDALQLGAALASLRGGGGMDPINRLRSAIGLDRLRILSADPALDRGTAIALGKSFGRRFYGEIITDGRGYNATQLEFRVTSWLSILASINTIGRHSVAAEYSRDY
jgi:translocation and assembly module TamB